MAEDLKELVQKKDLEILADEVIGHTDTSDIGDGTIRGAIRELKDNGAGGGDLTTNILNPSLQSQVFKGIAVANNGDGTITVSGTAENDNVSFTIGSFSAKEGETYKLVGCPVGGSSSKYRQFVGSDNAFPYGNRLEDYGNGSKNVAQATESCNVVITIFKGATVNLVFKPMVTTNLSATYDDFVPYTGSTGKLNGDLAEIKKEVVAEDVGNMFSINSTYFSITSIVARKVGKIVFVTADMKCITSIPNNTKLFTLEGITAVPGQYMQMKEQSSEYKEVNLFVTNVGKSITVSSWNTPVANKSYVLSTSFICE